MSKIIDFTESDPVWSLFPTGYLDGSESLEQGRDYRPDWRWRKLQRYLRTAAKTLNPNERGLLINDEKDQIIVDAFISIAHDDNSNQSIRWAFKAFRSNHFSCASSMVKAMTLTNEPTERLAYEMNALPQDIETFQSLFFDVKKYMQSQSFIASLYAPFQTMSSMDDASPASAYEAKERMWMMMSYMLGWKCIRPIIYRDCMIQPKDIEDLDKFYTNMWSLAGLEYGGTMRTFGFARPADHEKSLQVTNTNTQRQLIKAAKNDIAGQSSFYSTMLGIVTNNLPLLPKNLSGAWTAAVIRKQPEVLDEIMGPENNVPRLTFDFLERPVRNSSRIRLA